MRNGLGNLLQAVAATPEKAPSFSAICVGRQIAHSVPELVWARGHTAAQTCTGKSGNTFSCFLEGRLEYLDVALTEWRNP